MASLRSLGLLVAVSALIAAALASCDSEVVEHEPSDGGGGSGGVPFAGCEECGGATPVCIDDESCAAACPIGRALCHPDADASAASCCDTGEQCCTAQKNGYAGPDRCEPIGSPCPVECADDKTLCPSGEQCLLDPQTGTWSCTSDCTLERSCGIQCCPVGSRCENGICPLPDLAVDEERVGGSARIHRVSFGMNACEILEGCVDAPGERLLLRFDLTTPNIGEGDLYMGDPTLQPELFVYSSCHQHFHFSSYADYQLLDDRGDVVANGHKQAFCLLDYTPWLETAAPDPAYDCSYQGIQAGWSDVYGRYLPCQWVDVTDLLPGEYQLAVELNSEGILGESDYANNQVQVDVTLLPDSCPSGCTAFDETCCLPGNPCNLAGNGACDCGGLEPWDLLDCASCYDCLPATRCLGGCTADEGACCADGDPCNKTLDSVCDCAGNYEWDRLDCLGCLSDDPDCPSQDSCPGGCPNQGPSDPCCADPASDLCGYAGDGYCDCGGAAWDFADCFLCSCN